MKKAIIFFLGLMASNFAFADAIGFRVEAGMWQYEPSGSIRDSANVSDSFDISSELGYKEDEVFNGVVYFEHPIPILPNFRVGSTDLSLSGTGTIAAGKTWNGTAVPAGSVTSSVDLSHTEIGLYYEIVDVGFDFDLGLNAKIFDGTANIETATSSFSETIPMLYGHLGVPLAGGFKVLGDMSYISLDGDTFSDYNIRLRWDSGVMIGVSAGYRSLTIDYEDGNEVIDAKFDGPFVNATLTF